MRPGPLVNWVRTMAWKKGFHPWALLPLCWGTNPWILRELMHLPPLPTPYLKVPAAPLPSTSLRTWWGLFRQSRSSTQESSTRAYDGLPVLWGLAPGGTLGPDAWATGADRKGAGTHLASTAVHDALRGVVNLGLHMNSLFLLTIHLHPQNSKGRPAKIQGNEISLFCLGRNSITSDSSAPGKSHALHASQQGPAPPRCAFGQKESFRPHRTTAPPGRVEEKPLPAGRP